MTNHNLPYTLVADVADLVSYLNEAQFADEINIGDKVHLGFGAKGGTGFIGHVRKIKDGQVVLTHPSGKEYVGYISRATRLSEPAQSTDYSKRATRYFYRTEDVESLEELSPVTMKSYIKKAMKDRDRKRDQFHAIDSRNLSLGKDITKDENSNRLYRKSLNRAIGIDRAVDKL